MSTVESPAVAPEAQKRTIVVPLTGVEFHDSGDPANKNETTLRGHAAIFNSLSEDLGGFREIIEPGFFRGALRRKPDVRLLFNHDPNYVMARTASETLELREDSRGLHVFARVDKSIQWVNDLRKSMQRGDVDQMSFAFTLREDGDDWAVAEDGTVVRTLRADGADEIFDVSVVTYPAYRATSVNMRGLLEEAINRGRLEVPGAASDVASEVAVSIVVDGQELAEKVRSAALAGAEEEPESSQPEGDTGADVAPDEPVGESELEKAERNLAEFQADQEAERKRKLADLKARTRRETSEAKEHQVALGR